MKKYANKLGIKWYGNRFKIHLKGCYRMEINSKAFAIPILTASIISSIYIYICVCVCVYILYIYIYIYIYIYVSMLCTYR